MRLEALTVGTRTSRVNEESAVDLGSVDNCKHRVFFFCHRERRCLSRTARALLDAIRLRQRLALLPSGALPGILAEKATA